MKKLIPLFLIFCCVYACNENLESQTRDSTSQKKDTIIHNEADATVETVGDTVDSKKKTGFNFDTIVELNQVLSFFKNPISAPLLSKGFICQTPLSLNGKAMKFEEYDCYSLPEPFLNKLIKQSFNKNDSISIWKKEFTKFYYDACWGIGFYPIGSLATSEGWLAFYYTIDYTATQGGTYNGRLFTSFLSDSAKLTSNMLGNISHSTYNTYDYIDGEQIHAGRRTSETCLRIDQREDSLFIRKYSTDFPEDDEHDVYVDSNLVKSDTLLLSQLKR